MIPFYPIYLIILLRWKSKLNYKGMREQLKFHVSTRKLRQPINDKQKAKAEQCSSKNYPIPDYSILYTLRRIKYIK